MKQNLFLLWHDIHDTQLSYLTHASPNLCRLLLPLRLPFPYSGMRNPPLTLLSQSWEEKRAAESSSSGGEEGKSGRQRTSASQEQNGQGWVQRRGWSAREQFHIAQAVKEQSKKIPEGAT